jgi:malic enzyme
MLERYADKVLCFNDDIQGTASVALAGLETALQFIDVPLTEQRIVFLGAGSAAIGIAKLIVAAMQKKGAFAGRRAQPRLHVRHRRVAGTVPRWPVGCPEGVCT